MGHSEMRRVFAPGRVNLIGDHTDYTGGLVLPMAIQRGITITATVGGPTVEIRSDRETEPARFELPMELPAEVTPTWARHLAGVAAEMGSTVGLVGEPRSDLPVAGLSSSAAVQVATALALGHPGPPRAVAELCQAAEHRATGVPCGIMDQLTCAAGVDGHALLIDCQAVDITPIPVPGDVEVVIVHSGEHRELATSAYAERRAECEAAEAIVGPLRSAPLDAADTIDDPVLRSRARHVISENQRVRDAAAALRAGDHDQVGWLMTESHRSLARDFAVSTPTLDALVADLLGLPGVYGARLTGAGFGGAVVALARPGAVERGFVAHASAGARVL